MNLEWKKWKIFPALQSTHCLQIFMQPSTYDMKVVAGHLDSSTCHHLFYCGSGGYVDILLLILLTSLAIIVTVYFM